MIGKRHDLAFVDRERLKTRNCTPPKKTKLQRNTPEELNITPILFLFFLYSTVMKGKCMAAVHKMMVLFPHVRLSENLAITFY